MGVQQGYADVGALRLYYQVHGANSDGDSSLLRATLPFLTRFLDGDA
jgi:hypothetical protein